MPRHGVRYTVPMKLLATREGRGIGDLAAVLDMLRYEGAQVTDWSNDMEEGVLSIRSENYTPDRWASFGIHPTVTGSF